MQILFEVKAFEEYNEWARVDKKIFQRISKLIMEIRRNPFGGTGKPEPMYKPSPTRDALVVGICQYDDLPMSEQLFTLVKQAERLAKLLETQGGFKVTRLPRVEKKVKLGDSEETILELCLKQRVTLPDLEQAIKKLLSSPKESPTDTALLFFAGHGLVKEKEGFLATSEADNKSVYGFSLKTLRELLRNSPIKQQVVFLEACHSGAFFTHFEPDEKHDICFITSARAHEEALADGLLIKALLETLDCQKRLEDYITSERLINYLNKIEKMNSGWQRFVYRIHGESILLSGDGREMLKNLESIVQPESLPQKNQSVTIGDNATGNIVVVGDGNYVKKS